MMMSYDAEADAIYVDFAVERSGQIVTRDLGDGRYLDIDERGEVVGVELLGVSQGFSLEGIPRAEEIAVLLRSVPQPQAV
jgi:uncharacterized protein YuzE